MKYISICYLAIFVLISCIKQENCDRKELNFSLDESSRAIFSSPFYNHSKLVYINENGDDKSFKGETYSGIDGLVYTKPCGDNETQEVNPLHEYIGGSFTSDDSLTLSFDLDQFPQNCAWQNNPFEYMGDKMSCNIKDKRKQFGNTGKDIGYISKHLKDPESHDSGFCNERWITMEKVTLAGKEYKDIYASVPYVESEPNLFFKDGIGIIGFIDFDGVSWRFEE